MIILDYGVEFLLQFGEGVDEAPGQPLIRHRVDSEP